MTDTYKAFNKDSLRIFVIEDEGTGFSIAQKRYGHGCGLSQRGAQQRANSTDSNVNTYDKILSFYYPRDDAYNVDLQAHRF